MLRGEAGVEQVILHYAPGAVGPFAQVSMFDDGAHGDGEKGDGTFGGEIPPFPAGSLVRYYVEARSSQLAPVVIETPATQGTFPTMGTFPAMGTVPATGTIPATGTAPNNGNRSQHREPLWRVLLKPPQRILLIPLIKPPPLRQPVRKIASLLTGFSYPLPYPLLLSSTR